MKTFCISPKVKHLVKKLLAKVLSKKEPVEEELIEKEKSKKETHTEDETLKEEKPSDQEKLSKKPYIKKKPTDERKRPSENKNKQATLKRRKEIDLGAKRKILKPIKQLPKVEKVSNTKNEKEFGREEAPTRIESPIVEIDFDEAKVFLVIQKQQFKHRSASNIPQQLHYNLKLNGEEQCITVRVIEDNQGYIKVKEK